ncbi:MAG: hypothetical protein JXR37_04555 [Kiritimatiellae bacterium]|nr:hypothetical protein [Kiritimatiellia bacterium]
MSKRRALYKADSVPTVLRYHHADGYLPSDMSAGTAEEIEEELRLTYVTMTRARDFLDITWPGALPKMVLEKGDRQTTGI